MAVEFPDGVITATLTPMNSEWAVDYPRLVRHCEWLLDNGSQGIALLGTTGEANSLSVLERINVLDAVIEGGIPASKLMVGTGCCAFTDSVELTKHALSHDVGGVLMLPPFYYKKPSDEGLFASFSNIIERVGNSALRIFLYHFPRMSTVPISYGLIERLLKQYPDIIAGVKDSSGDWGNMEGMAKSFPGFRVFAGTEQYLLAMVRAGGAGCISATTNITTPLAARVYAARENAESDELQNQLTKLRLLLQSFPFVPTLKALVGLRNTDEGWNHMRPPHLAHDKQALGALTETLERAGLLSRASVNFE